MSSSSGSDGSCSSTDTDSADYVVEIPFFSLSKTGTYNCKARSVWYKATNNIVDRSSEDGDIVLTYGNYIKSCFHLSVFLHHAVLKD